MSTESAGRQRPWIQLVGAPELADPLRASGLRVRTYRQVGSLLRARPPERLRAVVVAGGERDARELQEVLNRIGRHEPLVDRVVWLPGASAALALGAVRAGAREVVVSSDPEELAATIHAVVEAQVTLPRLQSLERARRRSSRFEGMLSRCPAMWDLFELCVRVAPTDASVLILGETGTGKELLARALHRRSDRRGRFVAINCGAVPESLIDSELFGHEKGTFTGATGTKRGLFQHADGGTLFLDEIGDIPLSVQFRLLRVLQEGRIRPVGSRDEVAVDVRVVAATSQALEDRVRTGTFREDLLYRLDVVRVPVPPLRDRPEDVIFLFDHFLRQAARAHELPRPALGADFLEGLQAHPWPGNIREVENLAERLLLMQPRRPLRRRDLGRLLRGALPGAGPKEEVAHGTSWREWSTPTPPRGMAPDPEALLAALPLDPQRTLAENLDPLAEAYERRYLEAVLAETRGNVGRAVERTGLSRRTLQRRLRRLGIDRKDFGRR